MTTTRTNTKLSETEVLREELELTRQHLADTVQEMSRQLNVPRRMKESAASAFHTAGQRAKQVPELTRKHPKAAAAVGGAAALAVGATAWIMGRSK